MIKNSFHNCLELLLVTKKFFNKNYHLIIANRLLTPTIFKRGTFAERFFSAFDLTYKG